MKHQRSNSIPYVLAAVALALASCNRLPIYNHYQHISLQGWQQDDSLHFVVPVEQTGTYQVLVNIRATSIYPYTQLTLDVHQNKPKNYSERVCIDITDDKGNLKTGSNAFCDYSIPLHDVVTTADADTIDIAIAHNMSRELLPGIADIGIAVERRSAE